MILIKDLLLGRPALGSVTTAGWVRTKREGKTAVFLELNDGSSQQNIQVVLETGKFSHLIPRLQTGTSLRVKGELIPSPAAGQAFEIQAQDILIYGESDPETYPLQKKRHSLEFLRQIAHLRPRTNTFAAVARVRNTLAFGVHKFFQERGFSYVNTPIITASDAEGAGQMFQVTTLDLNSLPLTKQGRVDYTQDFFEKEARLTVSGQLGGEAYATALGRIYTFGPTFRAENSNTTRHLAEFWMIEPEMSFFELPDNMDLAEEFIQYLVSLVLKECPKELDFFNTWVEKGLLDTLNQVIARKFTRITYTEAVEILISSGKVFEYPVSWGTDLQSEHEKYLTDEIYKGPVIVTDYPKQIKAFYMKMNADGKTVRAMDVLVPRLGEIIGGSQREEGLETLENRIIECGMRVEDYSWYLDLRRYGSVPHSGFGLGFERLVQYVTGMGNIRDVIPFPRTVGNADF